MLIGCDAPPKLTVVFEFPPLLKKAVSPLAGTPRFQLPIVVHLLSGAALPVQVRVFCACATRASKNAAIVAETNNRRVTDIAKTPPTYRQEYQLPGNRC